jgi:hypothetical protein
MMMMIPTHADTQMHAEATDAKALAPKRNAAASLSCSAPEAFPISGAALPCSAQISQISQGLRRAKDSTAAQLSLGLRRSKHSAADRQAPEIAAISGAWRDVRETADLTKYRHAKNKQKKKKKMKPAKNIEIGEMIANRSYRLTPNSGLNVCPYDLIGNCAYGTNCSKTHLTLFGSKWNNEFCAFHVTIGCNKKTKCERLHTQHPEWTVQYRDAMPGNQYGDAFITKLETDGGNATFLVVEKQKK